MTDITESQFLEIKATGELPSPTGVALTILQITQKDDAQLEEISRIIQTDPALTGRLLKIANSSMFGRSRPIVSVQEAVVRVGIKVIRQLLLGLTVIGKYNSGACRKFDYQCFWSRSLAVGIAAQELSRLKGHFYEDEVFTWGLLSQIGRLAFATVYPNEYANIIARLGKHHPRELLEIEHECFSLNHVQLGKAMLTDWGLPEVQIAAMDGLYDPLDPSIDEKSRTFHLTRVLHLASELAEICVAQPEHRSSLLHQLFKHTNWFGIDNDKLGTLFDEIVRKWQAWGVLFDIPTIEIETFSQLMDDYRQRTHGLNASLVQTFTKPGLRILIVEPNQTLSQQLSVFLKEANHTVLVAYSAKDGLKLALEEKPQLIIAENISAEMNGLELCRTLRNNRFGQSFYFLLVTELEEETQLIDAFNAGIDDYLVKPISKNILHARICAGERFIKLQEQIEIDRDERLKLISEHSILLRRLEHAALTDPLTLLPNRRYATESLEKNWAAATRKREFITCMMVDVDHFKAINDKFGHAGGDIALKEIALTLRGAARRNDEVCRMGGEEFLIICSNIDAESALTTAERVREAIEEIQLIIGGQLVKLSISVGVSVQYAIETNPDALLRSADLAAYAAKRRGRNCVCMVTGTTTNQDNFRAVAV